MPNSTLFPLDKEPMKPDSTRRDPVLWLRRLVILSSPDSSTVIRNIEFRRGLNIIQTRQMETQGGPVAGHSVGKTLLMRLIRYTLGEQYFGTEETERNIVAEFDTACVVGHWTVAGTDWIVVRPLIEVDGSNSFATCSSDWQHVIDGKQNVHSHREFIQAVNDAVLSELPTFNLPRGRESKWLDVLGWLSRDYQCGYRRSNDWRHEDANPGSCLDREENSLIMQWIMGLMSPDEIELRIKHRQLLDARAKNKRSTETEQRRLTTLRPALWEKLELKEDAEVVDEQQSFNSVNPIKVVAAKIASLERLKKDRLAGSRVKELESEREEAQAKVNDAEVDVRSCRNVMTFIKEQIDKYERDPLHIYAKCQAEPTCWIREKARETAFDPSADDHLADLRGQLEAQERTLSTSQSLKKLLQKVFREKDNSLEAERHNLATELSGIDTNIGRWSGFETDASNYQSVASSVARNARSLKTADSDVESSLKLQDDIRTKNAGKVSRLSDVYQQILQQIFGTDAVARIQIDGNGLQPVPDKSMAPSGAAMSVMTTVLAFDIACLAASIAGIGQHPRFLMHDSPREGDMEGPLFRRLFEIVHQLENEFVTSDEISFQYIVTTTTSPPSELADENGPYVRDTMDARNDQGLLLRKRF